MSRNVRLDPLAIGLTLMCLLFVAVIAAEAMLLPWRAPNIEADVPSARSDPGDNELDARHRELLAQRAPLSAFQEILDRPLFASERRPAAVEEAAPVSRRGDQLAAQWRLTGIVRDDASGVAIVQDHKGARTLRLTVGSSVDGWKLAQIGADRIELVSGGDSVELLLRVPPESAPRAPKKP